MGYSGILGSLFFEGGLISFDEDHYGLKDTAVGGRGDYIVGDTFNLHFGTGEEDVVAGDCEYNRGFHLWDWT